MRSFWFVLPGPVIPQLGCGSFHDFQKLLEPSHDRSDRTIKVGHGEESNGRAAAVDLLKGKRQKGTKAPGPSEFRIQCAVADYLRRGVADGWLWNHFPAGELRTEETGGRLKRAGLQPGWFDLVLISPTGPALLA